MAVNHAAYGPEALIGHTPWSSSIARMHKKRPVENHRPSYRRGQSRLHQVLGLAGGIAGLLAVSDMTKLAVLENGLHFDDATPATGQDLLTFASCVL